MSMELVRRPKLVQDGSLGHIMRGRSIGFVPTMGALHEGHLSLVRRCRDENDVCVVSIFVNPTQFGTGEDLSLYPRDSDGDKIKLRKAGVDVLFMPDVADMYHEGATGSFSSTFVEPGAVAGKLCGAYRPGHFRGVATVVAKLLNIVRPARSYFGLKDYEQCVVVRTLIRDLNMPVEFIECPTIREHDGLAMSSRNQYLSPEERAAAAVIYRALSKGVKVKALSGSPQEADEAINDMLRCEQLVAEVQYAGCYDPATLDAIREFRGETLFAAAVRIGRTRLIDNMLV